MVLYCPGWPWNSRQPKSYEHAKQHQNERIDCVRRTHGCGAHLAAEARAEQRAERRTPSLAVHPRRRMLGVVLVMALPQNAHLQAVNRQSYSQWHSRDLPTGSVSCNSAAAEATVRQLSRLIGVQVEYKVWK